MHSPRDHLQEPSNRQRPLPCAQRTRQRCRIVQVCPLEDMRTCPCPARRSGTAPKPSRLQSTPTHRRRAQISGGTKRSRNDSGPDSNLQPATTPQSGFGWRRRPDRHTPRVGMPLAEDSPGVCVTTLNGSRPSGRGHQMAKHGPPRTRRPTRTATARPVLEWPLW